MIWASDLKREGGTWLATAREWIQQKKFNGSSVIWGSDQELRPTMTVREVEDLAAHVAAAVMNEWMNKCAKEKKCSSGSDFYSFG